MAKAVFGVLFFLAIEVQLCPRVELCPARRYGLETFDSKERGVNDISPLWDQLEETHLKEQEQKPTAALATPKCPSDDDARECFQETLQFLFLLAALTFAWNTFCYFRVRPHLHGRDFLDEETVEEPLQQVQLDSPPQPHLTESPPAHPESTPASYSEGPPPPYPGDPPPSYEESQAASNAEASVLNENPPPSCPHLYYRMYYILRRTSGGIRPVCLIVQRYRVVQISLLESESESESDSGSNA